MTARGHRTYLEVGKVVSLREGYRWEEMKGHRKFMAMPFGPRPRSTNEAPTGLRHTASVAIAKDVA